MIILNPEKAYHLPPSSMQRSGVEITQDELVNLFTMVNPYLDSIESQNQFEKNMIEKVGPDATYTGLRELRGGLKIIYDYLNNPETTDSAKAAIAIKLYERVVHCPPGFHDGVNAIVDGFFTAKNLDELLYRYRHELVGKLASRLTDEVHANNRFYSIASNAGYGIYPINKSDVYEGDIPDTKIYDVLEKGFRLGMDLFAVLQGLEEHLLSQLLFAGYEGSRTVFSDDQCDQINTQLALLFHEHPSAHILLETKNQLKQEQKSYQQAETQSKQRMMEFARHHAIFGDPEPYRAAKLDLLLKIKPEEKEPNFAIAPNLQTWWKDTKERLAALSVEDKAVFSRIQNLPRQVIVNRKPWLAATEAFNHAFYVMDNNEKILDLDWPKLRWLLWQNIVDNDYFLLTPEDNETMSILLEPKISSETKSQALPRLWDALNGDPRILIYFYDKLPEATIRQCLEQYPPNYNFFKWTVYRSKNNQIKQYMIDRYCTDFLPHIRTDPNLPLIILEQLTCEDFVDRYALLKERSQIKHYFQALSQRTPSDRQQILQKLIVHKENSHILREAIKHYPPAIKPISEFLRTCDSSIKKQVVCKTDKNNWNILMHVAAKAPGMIKPILTFLETCDSDIKNEVILQKDELGWNTLALASIYNPETVQAILTFLETCEPDIKKQVITQETSEGANALMIAARYHPKTFMLILDFLETYESDTKNLAISQHSYEGSNALMIGVRYHPDVVQPILNFLARCEPTTKNKVILQEDVNGWTALTTAVRYQPKSLQPILAFLATCDRITINQVILHKPKYESYALFLAVLHNPDAIRPLMEFLTKCDLETQMQILRDICLSKNRFSDPIGWQNLRIQNIKPSLLNTIHPKLLKSFLDAMPNYPSQHILKLLSDSECINALDEYSEQSTEHRNQLLVCIAHMSIKDQRHYFQTTLITEFNQHARYEFEIDELIAKLVSVQKELQDKSLYSSINDLKKSFKAYRLDPKRDSEALIPIYQAVLKLSQHPELIKRLDKPTKPDPGLFHRFFVSSGYKHITPMQQILDNLSELEPEILNRLNIENHPNNNHNLD